MPKRKEKPIKKSSPYSQFYFESQYKTWKEIEISKTELEFVLSSLSQIFYKEDFYKALEELKKAGLLREENNKYFLKSPPKNSPSVFVKIFNQKGKMKGKQIIPKGIPENN